MKPYETESVGIENPAVEAWQSDNGQVVGKVYLTPKTALAVIRYPRRTIQQRFRSKYTYNQWSAVEFVKEKIRFYEEYVSERKS